MSDNEETLYEVTVTVSFTEQFDHESDSKEYSEEFGEHIVREDIASGDIRADAMDVEATAEEVEA